MTISDAYTPKESSLNAARAAAAGPPLGAESGSAILHIPIRLTRPFSRSRSRTLGKGSGYARLGVATLD